MMRFHPPRNFAKGCVPMAPFEPCDGCAKDQAAFTMLTVYGRKLCVKCQGFKPDDAAGLPVRKAKKPQRYEPRAEKTKFTLALARHIRKLVMEQVALGESKHKVYGRLAMRYRVCKQTISMLVRGKTFKEGE